MKSLKLSILPAFLTALCAVNIFSQSINYDTAYVPVRVNANAMVRITPANSNLGVGDELRVMANTTGTLTLLLVSPQTSLMPQGSPRQANGAAAVRHSRGIVSLELHPQIYANAEISLHSINGKSILRDKAAAANGAVNILSKNAAPGVYLLSVKGEDGAVFSDKLNHCGGKLNINVSFGNERFSHKSITKNADAANAYGDWTVTINDAQDFADSTYTFSPVKRDNNLHDITLRALITTLPRYVLPGSPNFGSSVSVHDPSIFKDDNGTYYTFGSHFAVSSSTNLMRWTQVTSDGGHGTLYGPNNAWRTVLSAAFTHCGVDKDGNPPGSTWAPDVIKLNGKYYMYYSLSTFGSNRSYIGRVEANSATGPYTNSVEIVKTPDGTNRQNAIDAALLRDKNDRLWMSYGSFFGGLYMIELENSGSRIGLPKSGQGHGKRIWAEGSGGIEGPYIFYNPTTDYYYLMASCGSLSTNYNMRVARSRNPNGPFSDGRNSDVGTVSGTAAAGAGMKLAGNYHFNGASRGYAALGHNSVLVENGKYFVVYHTRYRNGTTGDNVTGNHNQFVNQLFFNAEGWPVMAPNRYSGESVGRVEDPDVTGDYDLLIHSAVNNNVQFMTSSVYTFDVSGTIRQGSTNRGTWERSGDYYMKVTLNNIVYSGVIVPQWINDVTPARAALSITAVSNAGVSLWANKKTINPIAR